MKKNYALLIVFWSVALCMAFAQQPIRLHKFPNLSSDTWFYRDTCRNVAGRFPGFSPFFMIYPDKACDSLQAVSLIKELGLEKYARTYSGSVCVMNPMGAAYDNKADLGAFKECLERMRIATNLKVIGIGKGATFVNKAIATHAGMIAGIVSIDGDKGKFDASYSPVPVYVTGKGASQTASIYIKQNKAMLSKKDKACVVYKNENEPLLQVVVNNKKHTSLAETIDDAWDKLLCKNYRFNNFKHTWYTGGSVEKYGDFELEPYIMPEEWGITRKVIEKDLLGTGTFLWYEFHPEATLKAPKGSVPLLLLLHGNNNDPRTQAETSGFIELCAEENFVVAELEWQGNGYAPMGFDGIEQVVYHMLKTYPQLDPSRVYAEGLSAGAATVTGLGIRKSYLFAAVGAQSAGLTPNRYMFGYNGEAMMNEVIQKRGFVEMPYFSVTGKDDEVVPFVTMDNWETNAFFCAWNAYQIMNGMEISTKPDFSLDPVFGIKLENRETVPTNKGITMEMGVQYKGEKPLIKVVVVNDYGHWNFKPDAKVMWDFFKQYARDPITKKLFFKSVGK